ncbi:hypothetical protein [Flammeovirga kamogawensis]|nr:hypothetical protein [Flammeovirga kamogawensis]MBB6463956.1 hypothetical protein [Flammeovirga kamogawensis]
MNKSFVISENTLKWGSEKLFSETKKISKPTSTDKKKSGDIKKY